jgi:hypothetical protein
MRAVVFNGLLHEFLWDGAPSLAPAMVVATLAFLSTYAVGTMVTMAAVTTLIGEGPRRAGQVFQRPDIPQKLSMVSSVLAIAIYRGWHHVHSFLQVCFDMGRSGLTRKAMLLQDDSANWFLHCCGGDDELTRKSKNRTIMISATEFT